MASQSLLIDGIRRVTNAEAGTPLLYVLREMGFRGPKFGCGLAQCGACTVIVDGTAVRSCVTPVEAVVRGAVRTLDGLAAGGEPHPVQRAFMDEQAALCGYCTNGWIMSAVARFELDPDVTDQQIREMWAGLKCRCGAHLAMLRAARRAADAMLVARKRKDAPT